MGDSNHNATGNDGFNYKTDHRVNDHNSGILKKIIHVKHEESSNHQDLSRYQNQDGAGSRNIDNFPAGIKNRDTVSKKQRMSVLN